MKREVSAFGCIDAVILPEDFRMTFFRNAITIFPSNVIPGIEKRGVFNPKQWGNSFPWVNLI